MSFTDLEAMLTAVPSGPEGLAGFAGRMAAATEAVVHADAVAVWLWRTSDDGGRTLERVAVSNPMAGNLAAPPVDSSSQAPGSPPQKPGSRMGAPAVEPETVQVPLGPYGYATVRGASDPAALERFAETAPRLGDLLSRFLPRAELERSNRWLILQGELHRRAATSLASARTLEELGRLMEALADELMSIEYSGIYFIDPRSGRLRLVVAKGLTEAERIAAERTAELRHPGHVIRTGQPIDVPDTDAVDHAGEPPGHGRIVRSRLYLPVRVGGRTVGSIGFASARPANFGPRHEQALHFLCDLAGVTYARLEAQQETERKGQLIEATATANERLLSALDWRQAATAALALVGSALDVAALALVRLEPDEHAEQLDFVWQPLFGEPWRLRDRVARPTVDERERLGRNISVVVVEGSAAGAVMLKPVVVDGALWGVVACEPHGSGLAEIAQAERAALRWLANGFAAAIVRERLDRELRERHKVEAVSRLASGIAHEFNNLLWPVLLYSEILERGGEVNDRARQMLRDMRRSATRASELVQQVFAVSRSRDRVLQVVDVPELAVEVAATVRRSAPTSLRIVSTIDSDAGHVLGDEDSVRELLQNLLAQALDAASGTGELQAAPSDPSGGATIRLDVERVERDRGSWIRIVVCDDGHHASDAAVGTATARDAVGTETARDAVGMETARDAVGTETARDAVGMATARRLCGALGGEIALERRPGAGLVRELFLPIALREPAAHAEAEPSLDELVAKAYPTPSPEARWILLVDDDGAVLEVARQILESLEYEVEACSTPARALEVLGDGARPLSLLLTDLSMPGMDGLTLAREARRLRPALPIVFCTGFGDARAERVARELGAAAFIRKPIDFDQYAKTIRAAIEGSPRG